MKTLKTLKVELNQNSAIIKTNEDFICCKRISDGKLGLYDVEQEKFFEIKEEPQRGMAVNTEDEKVERDLESKLAHYKSEYEKASNSLANAYQEINLCHETIVEQAKEIWHYRHANELCSKERLV